MSEDISGSVEESDIVEVLDTNFSDNPNATEILQKFQELVQNADLLNSASAYLLDELISDAIFGVFLEVHHLRKTGNLVALDGHPENCDHFEHNNNNNNNNNNNSSSSNTILPLNSSSLHANTANTCSSSSSSSSSNSSSTTNSNNNNSSGGGGSGVPTTTTTTTNNSNSTTTTSTSSSLRIVDLPNYDIFGMSTAKKPIDCTCPNCDRLVSAARFAPHLEKCMGMGRLSSRIASRRLATKEVNSSSSSALSANSLNSTSMLTLAATYMQQTGIPTDDEDDIEWSSSSFEKRRKKINQNTRNNGTKKNNGKTC